VAYGGLLEKLDFKRCCAQMDALIWKQAKRLYELNIDVVLEGYGTRAMRDRVKVEAAQIGFQYQVIWVECPAEERLSRVRLRNQSLTDEGFFISDTEFYEMEALNENLGEDEPATRIDNR
jgi:predicted kinase